MHEEKRRCLRNLFSLYTYRTTMICPLKLVTTCIPHRTSGALDTLLLWNYLIHKLLMQRKATKLAMATNFGLD